MNPFRLLLMLIPFLLTGVFGTEDDPDDDPDDPEGKKGKGLQKPEGVTGDIESWVSKLIARETRKAKAQARTDAETAAQAVKDQEDADRARTDQEKKGEYEQAKASLEGERDGLKAERDTLQTTTDALTAYFTGQYETALKELPDTILAFKPADDASFETKSEWLTKAQEQAKKISGTRNPGNVENPKPGGTTFNHDEEVAAAKQKSTYHPV